jgi:hypothetical protein
MIPVRTNGNYFRTYNMRLVVSEAGVSIVAFHFGDQKLGYVSFTLQTADSSGVSLQFLDLSRPGVRDSAGWLVTSNTDVDSVEEPCVSYDWHQRRCLPSRPRGVVLFKREFAISFTVLS